MVVVDDLAERLELQAQPGLGDVERIVMEEPVEGGPRRP
jgi:hypothetical protein